MKPAPANVQTGPVVTTRQRCVQKSLMTCDLSYHQLSRKIARVSAMSRLEKQVKRASAAADPSRAEATAILTVSPVFFSISLVSVAEEGVRSLAKGWAPTCIGYSMQGVCKFGFYEVFKILYSNMLGEERTYLYRTSLYLAASASAEFFADIALSPMEAVKVRIQTMPGFVSTLRAGAPIIYKQEGLWGFYKGVVPLWCRQIPYTMMKFACFERTVEALYQYVVPKPRDQCTKSEQLVVTFAAGYIAGVFCAIVSHPADTIVSKLNQDKGSTAMGVAKKLGMAGKTCM
ncbi:Phosphate carrier protein, mitochondrial [Portunus trituberculatus]|uniref:Phosphate carrier protein, mitochondrial n=1 Tax=Portunus trituberculatus TaxID=210409 RepID=A0A5B7DAW9_PORTR|nr:Phosphate carrier protein, mitochondrial [Portunus trituberculatus]